MSDLRQDSIEFGVDYFSLMRELEQAASPDGGLDNISDASLRVFLHLWGLTSDEIDRAAEHYSERRASNSLGELREVAARILEYIGPAPADRERLVLEMGAIGFMDFAISAQEKALVSYMNLIVDMKPSEYYTLLDRGKGLAKALHRYGEVYKDEMRFSFDVSSSDDIDDAPDSSAPAAPA